MAAPSAATSPNKQPSLGNQAAASSQPNVQMPAAREFNYASLCKMGQETVQDIISRTNELFQMLKAIQLPSSEAATQQYADRKAKLDEQTKQLAGKFKALHLIYDKLNEYTADMSMIDVDHMVIVTGEKHREQPKFTNEEHKEIVEQIQAKNVQLKEIIDKLRTVMWEINTMMAMRKIVAT